MSCYSSLLSTVAVAFVTIIPSAVRADSADGVTIQIDAVAVQNDRRLEKPVSVSAQALSLKTLLDQISTQSSVDIRIHERDPASSYPVLAECANVSTSKIMNALYGLLSIRKGEWAWMRSGVPGAYRYSLHETPRAKNRTVIYNRILDGLLSNYLEVLRDLAPMKMDERKLHRDALKRALFLDDDAYVNFYFENEIFWTEAKFFLSALTPGQQNGVLRGVGVSVALKDLAPEVYDLFHQAYLHTNRRRKNDDGIIVPVPEPEAVVLYRREPDAGRESFAPAVLISMGNMGMTWMGTGGLEAGVRSAIERAWMLPSDSADDAAGTSIIVQMKETEEARLEREKVAAERAQLSEHLPSQLSEEQRTKILNSANKYYLSLDTALGQLATGSSTPLLAILPPGLNRRFETPAGETVNQYLASVEGMRKLCFHKWRDGVLLINHPWWLTEKGITHP